MSASALTAALALAAVLAGCLSQRDDGDAGPAGCSAYLNPSHVPADAPPEGGRGPRTLTITLGAGTQLAAWWVGDANGTVETVSLRSTHAQPAVVLHAPAGRDVHLLSGSAADGTRWQVAATVAAGSAAQDLALADPLVGDIAGTWDDPASAGFGPDGPSWRPGDLTGLGDGVQVVALDLDLTWTNGPAGGADFGIAVATGPSSFQYNNAGYQATPGPQSEHRSLTGDDLAGYGWGNGTPARAGPSISTGAFATTGIAYELAWSADLADPDASAGRPCDTLGPVRAVDVTEA